MFQNKLKTCFRPKKRQNKKKENPLSKIRLVTFFTNLIKFLKKKFFFQIFSKLASKKQEYDRSTKQGKNGLKIAHRLKKSNYIKKGGYLIKNPSRYVFYKLDQIFKKKQIFHFSPKLASKKQECQKSPKICLFLTSKRSTGRQKFLAGKKISQKSANMYIFKLIKYWRPISKI